MLPAVSVPVLSVQMTSVEPSVSTAVSRFTSAWRAAIRRRGAGGAWLALAAGTGAAAAGPLPGGLTTRQAEVLRLLAAGMSNKQIAAELYLSPATVERHLATIYRKLGLAGRVEAARYALAHGLAATMS